MAAFLDCQHSDRWGVLNNDLLGSVRCASHSLRGLPAMGLVHH